MTSEQWQRVKELFEAAADRGPAERAAFLAQVCADDPEVKREVESLLAAHEADSNFMNKPVGNLLVGDKPMLAAGQHFGQYESISPLGEGGMGQVYLAVDTRLGRKVALKLLPSSYTNDADRVRRFELEARAASALNHPNIVTIHEIGQTDSLHFIATEFVDGDTLRERMTNSRMTVGEVLDVAAQVASALQAAHEAGIVHRDIKPENIMLRRDRVVKVLDFGLAKLTPHPAVDPGLAQSMVQTNPGVVMGTVGYMSPEQARGQDVDARTDIWSLGVVLYEMMAGRPPFTGETPSHVIVSILESAPPPLSGNAEVPAELERIISKALRKERAERYQTAGAMALDLKNLKEELEVEARLKRGLQPKASGKEFAAKSDGFGVIETIREPAARTGHIILARPTVSVEYLVGKLKLHKTFAGAALPILLVSAIGLTFFAVNRNKANLGARGKKSIAVLPLKPINAANRDEIYEVGIAESLINRLGSVKGFVVRPLSATRKYTDVGQNPIAAGKEQQVDYVLASNYQVAGGKIRVTAQLFDVASGQTEETYKSEADAANIFAMQDAIAGAFANKLLTRFAATAGRPAAKRGTTNEEAYRLYLQGRNLMMRRNAGVRQKAIEYFEQAIRLDPNYASAYAGMARAYLWSDLSDDGFTRTEKVKEVVKKALELDNNLAEAYVARADLELVYEWDFAAVEKDLTTAIELEPNNDVAHWLYALLLAYRSRFDEAMAEIETAQAIDPGALVYMRDRGRILYYARRYDEAIVQLKRVIDLDENFESAYGWLRFVYAMKSDETHAYEMFLKTQMLERAHPDRVEIYRQTHKTAGWQGVRRKVLEFSKLDEHEPGSEFYLIASLSVLLGEKEQAFEYLNKAVERREWRIVMLNVDPTLDSLRDDPRFAELVGRVGLK